MRLTEKQQQVEDILHSREEAESFARRHSEWFALQSISTDANLHPAFRLGVAMSMPEPERTVEDMAAELAERVIALNDKV
jgi:hypothetical protein